MDDDGTGYTRSAGVEGKVINPLIGIFGEELSIGLPTMGNCFLPPLALLLVLYPAPNDYRQFVAVISHPHANSSQRSDSFIAQTWPSLPREFVFNSIIGDKKISKVDARTFPPPLHGPSHLRPAGDELKGEICIKVHGQVEAH